MTPTEEQTYREGVNRSLSDLKDSMERGFKGVFARQDHTNGTVAWTVKMIYLAIGGLGVLTVVVLPFIWAFIQAGRI